MASIPSHDPVLGLVQETKNLVEEFNSNENIDPFLTRKSNQVCLAVLQCSIGDQYKYYRGRNMEFSIPTGSICAERSAITNAFANELDLHRKHLTGLAVIDPSFENLGREPCGVCKEWIEKIQEESERFVVITFPNAEFNSIYEWFPANYPVDNVDSAETQRSLDAQWECTVCATVNSGYSAGCFLCGKNKGSMGRYSMFKDPSLTLDIVNTIFDQYHPETAFSFRDIKGKLDEKDLEKELKDVPNALLQHLASRKILTRKQPTKKSKGRKKDQYRTTELFVKYRDSLLKNLPLPK